MTIGHGVAIGSGLAAQNVYNSAITQSTSTSPYMGNNGVTTGTINTWLGQQLGGEDNHVFSCQKVENGWTFTYRNKTHIASTVDEMMEQMKAAMVVERIEK